MPIVPKKNADNTYTFTISSEEFDCLTKQIDMLNRKREKSKEYAQKRRELLLQKQQEEAQQQGEEKPLAKPARRTTTKLIFGKPVEE